MFCVFIEWALLVLHQNEVSVEKNNLCLSTEVGKFAPSVQLSTAGGLNAVAKRKVLKSNPFI
jgi:hypothetical protein